MPADAVNYGKLACELNDALSDGRIDKIIMSGSTTLALGIRARGKNNTLLITAATSPRCFLTDKRLKSTDVPLSFCLHLRRHIGGGGISRIYALPFERILGVDIISRGDLGEPRRYTLYIEIMGKYSNVVTLILSSVLFTIMHLGNADFSGADEKWIVLLYYFISSLTLMALGIITGGFESSIGFHYANNLFVAVIENKEKTKASLPSEAIFISDGNLDMARSLLILIVISIITLFCALLWRRKWEERRTRNIEY